MTSTSTLAYSIDNSTNCLNEPASIVLALMRHTSCLNKFYYPTEDINMKMKMLIPKCKDD